MVSRITVKIEDLLESRGRSVYWLAKETGIAYTTLLRLKQDKALGVNFVTLEKLCGALACEPGDLVKLSKSEDPKRRLKTRSGRSHNEAQARN